MRAVSAAASYAFSKPKALDFYIQSDVINLELSYRPEFRVLQSSLELLDRYDERIFDTVFSVSQEINIGLLWAGDDDFKRQYTAFHGPERPQD